MKSWVATTIRATLIVIVGLVGLTSLLASACGLLLSTAGTHGIVGPVLSGFAFAAVCLGIVIWVSVASQRGLKIALGILLACLVISWFAFHRVVHPRFG